MGWDFRQMKDAVVGIAVVHFGDPEPTTLCVESLMADPSVVGRRVVVVDNSCNFDSLIFGSDVSVLKCPGNPGYGVGANAGLAAIDRDEACTAYVVLNNDTTVCPGFLDAAAGALEVGVGAAGGPIRDPVDSSTFWYTGGGVNFLTGTVWQKRASEPGRHRRDVGFIPATAMAISPTAWRDVGGFDPSFFLYNEDVDLCLRFRRLGWRLLFEPGMVCIHRLGGETGSGVGSPLYLENLTKTRLLPFRSLAHRLYLAGVHSVYNVLRAVGLAWRLKKQSGPYVAAVARGHIQALKTIYRPDPDSPIASR